MRVWVTALLTGVSVWLAQTVPAQAKDMNSLQLNCPEHPPPNIAALCLALRERLIQSGYDLTHDAADVVVNVQGRDLGSAGLAAQLVVTRSAQRILSPELALTVSGRDDIPKTQMLRFADDLIASATLAKE